MKIKIECSPNIDEPEKKMFEWLKGILRDGLDKFKLEIEGTEMVYEQ